MLTLSCKIKKSILLFVCLLLLNQCVPKRRSTVKRINSEKPKVFIQKVKCMPYRGMSGFLKGRLRHCDSNKKIVYELLKQKGTNIWLYHRYLPNGYRCIKGSYKLESRVFVRNTSQRPDLELIITLQDAGEAFVWNGNGIKKHLHIKFIRHGKFTFWDELGAYKSTVVYKLGKIVKDS